MKQDFLSVRELQETDINLIADYWLNAGDEFLTGMGVDLTKMPAREDWIKMLTEQLSQSNEEKKSYCIIWQLNNKPVGHSNVNKIKFGEEAFMHLHLWNNEARKKGIGTTLVKMTLPWFFDTLKLKKIYSEPYALNPAPNKTLERAGFSFVKEFITIPGWLNFEQSVKLWELSYDNYRKL
ncbi:MAG: GNAT family protein [Bacteroidota bacterium]